MMQTLGLVGSLVMVSVCLAGDAGDSAVVFQCDFDGDLASFQVDPYQQGGHLANDDAHSGTTALACRGMSEDLKVTLLPPSLKAEYRCSSSKQRLAVTINVADYIEREPLHGMKLAVTLAHRETGARVKNEFHDLKDIVSTVECPIEGCASKHV